MGTSTQTEPLANRLEPLRSFLSEVEAANQVRLTADQSEDLTALIEHAWPGVFNRQYFIHAFVWCGFGAFIAQHFFGG